MLRVVAIALSILLCTGQVHAQSSPERLVVDLKLVLAVDISGSVSTGRWLIQREGYVRAFRSPEVQRAIQSGTYGAIAVTFVQWSNPNLQIQNGGWVVIRDPKSSLDYAAKLAKIQRAHTLGSTAIGSALLFSARLINDSSIAAGRNVIDISGDGKQTRASYTSLDDGVSLQYAREYAIERGITINGLPILGDATESNLVEHYRDEVIGGPGAFMVVVENPDDVVKVAESIRRKLVLEIASSD